jgi:hypothetical protein
LQQLLRKLNQKWLLKMKASVKQLQCQWRVQLTIQTVRLVSNLTSFKSSPLSKLCFSPLIKEGDSSKQMAGCKSPFVKGGFRGIKFLKRFLN